MSSDEVLVIVEVLRVKDAESLAIYRSAARAQMQSRGGQLIARQGKTFFGKPDFGSLMVQRWPSEAAFVDWMNSDEYRPLLERRLQAVDVRIAIVPVA